MLISFKYKETADWWPSGSRMNAQDHSTCWIYANWLHCERNFTAAATQCTWVWRYLIKKVTYASQGWCRSDKIQVAEGDFHDLIYPYH